MAGRKAPKDFKLVCAIDIGTSYTGYAYCWNSNPNDVIFNSKWGVELGLPSYKTPTTVLTNIAGDLEEFGYDAEYKYCMLQGMGDANGMELYRHFVHQLVGHKTLTNQTKVKSDCGTERPAFELIIMMLKYIKQHLMKAVESKKPSNNDICWLLTVPSTYNDERKTFYKNAALQADLIPTASSDQLCFVPESKAAAFYCRSLDSEKYISTGNKSGINFNVGAKFMIIDAGGTIKVSTHEVKADGDVTEVTASMTDNTGGDTVNEQFEKLLTMVFGENFIQEYKENNRDFWFQHVDVLFEKKKREYDPDSSGIKLPLKARIENEHKRVTGNDIDDIIDKYNQLGISSRHNDIIIYKEAFAKLHEPILKNVLPKIEAIQKSQDLKQLKYIYVVGNVAESEVLIQRLSSRFTKYVILVPESASTAVLRGAICYGFNPRQTIVNQPVNQPQKREHKWVCAIDFGTTYSGYAYYKEDDKDPDTIINSIKMNKEWDNPLGLSAMKAPTSVLTGPDGHLDGFGFLAEYKYGQLCSNDEANGCNLYKHFKMLLHNEKELNRKTLVTSVTGTKRPAIEIFTMALGYMKDQFIEAVHQEEGSPPDITDIRWVITVPAIWSYRAKQFMREAAHQAGMIAEVSSKQLLFALEPEAAALYCQDLKINSFKTFQPSQEDIFDFSEGSKYMVIDAGGGTVDISVQQVLPQRNIKQLLAPSGGGWGGNYINSEYESLMNLIFGPEFIQVYKKDFPEDWLELETSFEKQKRSHKPDGRSSVSLPMPVSFDRTHEDVTRNKVRDVVDKFADHGVSFKKFRLVIDPNRVMEFYQKVIVDIIPHVAELLKIPKLSDLQHIFLVGGFSESDFLKKAIGDAFFNYVVLTPENSGSAVIRGAVIYGHSPERIQSRVAAKTYGCPMSVPFIEGKHDPRRKVIDEFGKPFCRGIFEKYITEGDEIRVGECKIFISYPFSSKSTFITKPLLSSNNKENTYGNDPGVSKMAELKIPMIDTKGGVNRKIETKVYFGGSEITVESRDAREGGKVVQAVLNFLCDTKV